MADYQAQLDIYISNLGQLDRLQRGLEAAENRADSVARRIRTLNGELQRTNTILQAVGTEQPRGERGQFVADPERRQRQAAYAEARRIRIQTRQQRIEATRTRADIAGINEETNARGRANAALERRIYLESRLNSATDLYQRKLEEFSRGGGGRRLSQDLQDQVATIQQAFQSVTANGTRNLGLVRSLATELGRVVERQNEANRLSTFQSKSFYQTQELERRIGGLRERGAPVAAFGTVGVQMRELRSLSQRGNEFEASNVTRRLSENLNRIERELADTFRQAQISQNARLARNSWQQFFADAVSERQRLQAPLARARQSWQQFFQDAASEASAMRRRPTAFMSPEQRVAAGVLDPDSLRQSRLLRVSRARQQREEQAQAAADQRDRRTRALSEGLIGGAFPLLFGQGPVAALLGGVGGAAGGFRGDGFGFGLSLIGTALGDAMTKLQDAAIDTAKSLKDPITNFQKFADAGLLASKAQEQQIRSLIEYGNSAKAASIIQEELSKKIGVLGLRDMANLDEQSVRLSKAWAELNVQMQAAISGPLAGLLEWAAKIIEGFNAGNRREAQRKDFTASLPEEARKEFNRRRALNVYGATGESDTSLMREFRSAAIPLQPPSVKIDPQKAQEEADKRRQEDRSKEDALLQRKRQTEDFIRSSREQIRQFDYQVIDLQRQATDYNRKIKEDIFNKEQQIQRDQISNDRLRRQITIDTVDLEYRRKIANEDGRAAAVLAAEADLMKVRSTNEADIEAAKRNLEIDIAKQKRDTENYIYGLAREADSIRRTTLKYELDVEDYKLKVAREIDDIYLNIGRQQEDMFTKMQRSGATGGLSALIGGVESFGGNYGAFNRGGTNSGHVAIGSGIDPNLTNMTIAEIQRRQLAPGVPRSQQLHAAGKYQIIGGTLRGLMAGRYGQTGVKPSDPFSPENQEKLFAALVQNRIVPGNINATMRGLRQEWIGLQNVKDADLKKAILEFMGSGASQLATPPSSQIETSRRNVNALTGRPQIAPLPVSSVRSTTEALDAQGAKIKTDQIKFQEKLNQLQESAALQRVLEAAQGENIVNQKQKELAFAIAEKDSVAVMSADAQEIAKFDARALETVSQEEELNRKILKNTKLTGKEKKELQDATEKYVTNLKTTLDYEKQILRIQQQQRFNAELTNLQLQTQTRGAGVGAGFFGGAAQKFEQEMMQSGDIGQATQLAQATRAFEIKDQIAQMQENLKMLLDPTYRVIEGAKAMGSAFGDSFKGVISGSMSAQEALANFFQRTADHFLDMAAQIIAQQAVLKLISFGLGLIPGFGAAAKTDLGPAAANLAQYAPLPGRAMGGPVAGGMPYMVGERGPELFVPGSSGSIVPNHQLGGGDVSIMVNVDASGTSVQGDDQKGSELGRLVAVAVRQEMIKQKRPGGILAS